MRNSELPTPAAQSADSLGADLLSVVLIGPDENRRSAVSAALAGPLCGVRREIGFYPDVESAQKLIERNYDVVIVDLDSNPEAALDLVEAVCCSNPATVMVYSSGADAELMIRCMRAGAREFLTEPFVPTKLAEALVRASARRTASRVAKRADGKLFVFWGAKGGTGVTTLASHFALWLARDTERKTLLIDLDLPLGDAALGLGVSSQYSTVEALINSSRLDANFLGKLLVQHDSGLSVLASPGKMMKSEITAEAIEKLLWVARQEFDYIVVDSGSKLDLAGTALFDEDAMIYLVTLVSIPELRNSNRIITEWLAAEGRKFEVVINRYARSAMAIDDEQLTKALTREAQWRIPEYSAAARKMDSTAMMLAQDDSPVSMAVRRMARAACGLSALPEKKRGKLSLF